MPNQEQTAIHKYYKENKILRTTANKGCKGPLQGELQTTDQGNKRGHKQIKKYFMLMVSKNQYCENGHTTQSNVKIQCYLHHATYDPLPRTGKKHLKLHMEPKESLHSH